MAEPLLTFVHMSDTHIGIDPEYGKQHTAYSTQISTTALVKQINALPFKVDFVLHTGDVAYDPDASAYYTARDILSELKYPIYYLAGNHDHATELQGILLNQKESRKPYYYEFEVNGVQMVCLDSNGPAEVPRGNIVPEQLEWLDGLCSAQDNRPMVVAVHHHLLPVGAQWWDEYMRVTNGEAVHDVLRKAQPRLRGVFFGHVHQSITMYKDGVLYNSALSSWTQFRMWPGLSDTVPDENAEPGFSVVTISRDQTFIRRWRFQVEI